MRAGQDRTWLEGSTPGFQTADDDDDDGDGDGDGDGDDDDDDGDGDGDVDCDRGYDDHSSPPLTCRV